MSYPQTTVFYPLDEGFFQRWRRFGRVPSLEGMCYDMVVNNARLKECLDPVCHTHLYPGIMAAALMKGYHTTFSMNWVKDEPEAKQVIHEWAATMHVLEHSMTTWPRRKFSLGELLWHLDNWQILFSVKALFDPFTEEDIRRGFKRLKDEIFTGKLVHCHDFNDFVKTPLVDIFFDRFESKTSPLRVLDLRGYTLGDCRLKWLLEKILSVDHKCQSELNSASRSSGDASMQESVLDVYVDCCVTDNDTLQLLRRVLELNSTSSPAVRLHVSTYESYNIDCQLALEMLHPEDLTGICLRYNKSGYDGRLRLLKRFRHLRSLLLDIGLAAPELCAEVRDVLMALPNLRLDLSYNDRKDCVPLIFGHVAHVRLEFLDLSKCNLSNNDLTYLAEASFLKSLRELKLSYNTVLSEEFPVTLRLLESVAASLQVLEIAQCGFSDSQLEPLVKCILRMSHLLCLNICNEAFTRASVCAFVPLLAELPHLEFVVLLDFREDEDDFWADVSSRARTYRQGPHRELKFYCAKRV